MLNCLHILLYTFESRLRCIFYCSIYACVKLFCRILNYIIIMTINGEPENIYYKAHCSSSLFHNDQHLPIIELAMWRVCMYHMC